MCFLKRFRIGEPPLVFPPKGPPAGGGAWPAGLRPVLPVVAGPAFSPQQQQPARPTPHGKST
jgi:hypothetical protein